MTLRSRGVVVCSGALVLAAALARAQDLAPRAYVITPVGFDAVTLTDSFSTGSVFVDPAVHIENAEARFQTQVVSYYHSFDLLGRSSNITVFVPYAVGNARGTVVGQDENAYRSGLADSRIRFAINLKSGPAMSPREFSAWREKHLIGFSFTAILPTGQYDAGRLVNIGSDRCAFKPEIGDLAPLDQLGNRYLCRRLVFRTQLHLVSGNQPQDAATGWRRRSAFDVLF